jgi:hypothetical protein
MTNTSRLELALSTATEWLALTEEEDGADAIDRNLHRAIATYARDLRYRLELLKPYEDDLCRLRQLKAGLRSLDSVYDFIGEHSSDNQLLPAEVRSLLLFLGTLIADLGTTIGLTESLYPAYGLFFASDRKMYSEWRAGRGPLAGEPWDFEDKDISN